MAVFIVERYLPRLSPAILATLELGNADPRTRWVRSLVLPADETSLCVFVADSADLVAEANARAGLEWERISAAIVVGNL
jgi:hypothetical protein